MDEKLLKDAQWRKGLSIAYFNSLNAAIELVKLEGKPKAKKGKKAKKVNFLSRVIVLRDELIEEHKKYYSTVISNVGVNYKKEDSVAKLQNSVDLESLQICWRLLSADERKDPEIVKVAQELKKKFKNEKA